ncbi:MAG: transposase [Betaproteobacteria bacterium]|nr:transposase [Betaproteobacteria bacterium]
MPRRPRLNIVGLPLHIVQRGNNRSACFFNDEDRQLYLHWLGLYAQQTGCAIHAYVLMTNHVHLLVTPSRAEAPAKLLQSLGRRYVQYINKFYKRSGTLWEGRYKASLVHADEYLLACQRYIELNPVRAGMVAHPRDYDWSSYRANAEGKADTRIARHTLLNGLGTDDHERKQAYAALFNTELDPEVITAIRAATGKGQVLGGERFKDEIAAMTNRRTTESKRGRKPKELKPKSDGEQIALGF